MLVSMLVLQSTQENRLEQDVMPNGGHLESRHNQVEHIG